MRTEHNGAYRLVDADLEIDETAVDTYGIVEGDPLSASVRCDWSIALARGAWRTRVETSSALTADATSFLLTDTLDAYEGDQRVFAKSWSIGDTARPRLTAHLPSRRTAFDRSRLARAAPAGRTRSSAARRPASRSAAPRP